MAIVKIDPRPIELRAMLTVDRSMVRQQYRGVRLNDLPSLYPFNHLRDELTGDKGIKRWLKDMAAQGYELLTPLGDVLVWGPYPHKRPVTGSDGEIAVGRHMGEDVDPHAADFLFTATFLTRRAAAVDYERPTVEDDYARRLRLDDAGNRKFMANLPPRGSPEYDRYLKEHVN